MSKRHALLFDLPEKGEAIMHVLQDEQYEVSCSAMNAWRDWTRPSAFSKYSLVLVDLGMPDLTGSQILMILRSRGERPVPFLFIGANRKLLHEQTKSTDPFLLEPHVDWVEKHKNPEEFLLRLHRLLKDQNASQIQRTHVDPLAAWNIPDLRSDESGRLDARRVADFFGWTLTTMSDYLGRTLPTVSKTPDAVLGQEKLETLERIAFLVSRLIGPKSADLRKLVNSPIPEFDGAKPGDILLKDPAIVLSWLEDRALGQPG